MLAICLFIRNVFKEASWHELAKKKKKKKKKIRNSKGSTSFSKHGMKFEPTY